ncbi:unnamed protein product [Ascophyllum nodosum]
MEGLFREVQNETWDGMIPAELSMDSSEITSLQRPLPLYLLLPRMAFLPCIADTVSHHFGEVGPDAQRNLWLEDTASGEPLRWHIPTGALFDLIVGSEEGDGHDGARPRAWSDEVEGEAVKRSILPWKITVHFQGCPQRQVFPLEKEEDIRRHYMNALKQALYLQLGSSHAGMTLAKENQTRLWHAVRTNEVKVFREIDALFGKGVGLRVVPVRVLVGGAPPSQLPIPPKRPNGEILPITEGDARDPATSDVTQDRGSAKLGTPLRGKGEDRGQAGYLGAAAGSDGAGEGAEPLEMVTVKGSGSDVEAMLPLVLVQGVEVPLDAPVAQLWGALRHPDHFLYVVVRKRR